MTTRWHRFSLFALAALVGLAGTLVWRRAHRRQAEQQAVAAERGRLAAAEQQLQARLAALARERTQLETELAAHVKQNARPPRRPPGMMLPPPPDAAQLARQATQARARLALKYAAFYRKAGVGAATAERFESLLLEHEAQERDMNQIAIELPAEDRTEAVTEPYGPGAETELMDPAVAAMRRRMKAQFEADQIALLGEAGYRALQAYQRDEPKRQILDRFAGDLILTGHALTPAQSREIDAALAEIDFGGKMRPDKKLWPDILARMQDLLSAPQLAVLKKQSDRAESDAAQAAFSRLLREQAQAEK
jgi:hypothetical protein